jgi:hypothetical protein
MAVPVAEETQAIEPMPDNLVDLRRIRESSRFRILSGGEDISDRISPQIPASPIPSTGTAIDLPAAEGPADRIPADSPESTRRGFPEEVFLWRQPDIPKRSVAFHAIKFTLLFTAFGTMLAYLLFLPLRLLAEWAIR